jgi:hypothetical protein
LGPQQSHGGVARFLDQRPPLPLFPSDLAGLQLVPPEARAFFLRETRLLIFFFPMGKFVTNGVSRE